jgi:NADH dehydrogenase
MATVSRFQAIARIGRLQISGFVAWMLWLGVHLFALTGFKNRIATLFNWTVAFVGRGRPQRTITTSQVFARDALRGTGQLSPACMSSPAASEKGGAASAGDRRAC